MKKDSTNQLYNLFLLGGFLFICFGIIHLSAFLQSNNPIKLYDTIINTVFGILFLISSKLLKLRKTIVIYPVIISIILSLIYSYLMNRGFNVIFLGYGGYLLYWIYQLKKHKTLK